MECLIVRRGGEAYELPVLNEAYPANVTVTAGSGVTASFLVQITTPGNPAEYTYQWYRNGAAVSGANGSTYTASGLTAAGTYSICCEVTNKAGSVQSRIATLTVRSLPVLNASYPADVSVVESASASAAFTVSIATAGSPASYTYQWYVNGAAVSGATSASYTKSGLTATGSHTVYCKVTSAAGTVQSRTATLTVVSSQPVYTYTGTSSLEKENTYHWKLKLLTSGTLKFTHLGTGAGNLDVFLVGGGGSGGAKGTYTAGAGGGYTKTGTATVKTGVSYTVTIGAGGSVPSSGSTGNKGGTSSAFGLSAAGGDGCADKTGGNGGTGGQAYNGSNEYDANVTGGTNGGNGADCNGNQGTKGGVGQGTTTREFGEASGTLYSGGGGGAGTYGLPGGKPGGGRAAGYYNAGSAGVTNTGGGGGGSYNQGYPGSGGSGIVVIRNHR